MSNPETYQMYAVSLPRTKTLATRDGFTALFHNRKDAVELRDALEPHIGRGKVVRVKVSVEIVERAHV